MTIYHCFFLNEECYENDTFQNYTFAPEFHLYWHPVHILVKMGRHLALSDADAILINGFDDSQKVI